MDNFWYYLNDDHSIRTCTVEEWFAQREFMHSKHVADETINNNRISTIWLGIDHSWMEDGGPVLFETMVFDACGEEIYMRRYKTWDEALVGHKKAVEWVLNGCKD